MFVLFYFVCLLACLFVSLFVCLFVFIQWVMSHFWATLQGPGRCIRSLCNFDFLPQMIPQAPKPSRLRLFSAPRTRAMPMCPVLPPPPTTPSARTTPTRKPSTPRKMPSVPRPKQRSRTYQQLHVGVSNGIPPMTCGPVDLQPGHPFERSGSS